MESITKQIQDLQSRLKAATDAQAAAKLAPNPTSIESSQHSNGAAPALILDNSNACRPGGAVNPLLTVHAIRALGPPINSGVAVQHQSCRNCGA